MDRVIFNTAVLLAGTLDRSVPAAFAGLDTLVLEEAAPACEIRKIICYGAGNLAGIFGYLTDGRKLIVNTHALVLGPDAAEALSPLLRETGPAPGLYLARPGFDPGLAADYVRDRLRHFEKAGEMMSRPRQMEVDGEYTLDILRPKLRTPHRLYIQREDGVLTGTHVTENDTQPMQDLTFDGRTLRWRAYSGTTSSELFAYELEVFDDILLGATWRVDGPSPSPFRSPVSAERVQKMLTSGPSVPEQK